MFYFFDLLTIRFSYNKFSGIIPNVYSPQWREISRNTFQGNTNIASVNEFLQFLYENRATYINTTTGAPGVNILDTAEPTPAHLTPAQAYADPAHEFSGKWYIHVLTTDPFAEGFRVWTINYDNTSEGV